MPSQEKIAYVHKCGQTMEHLLHTSKLGTLPHTACHSEKLCHRTKYMLTGPLFRTYRNSWPYTLFLEANQDIMITYNFRFACVSSWYRCTQFQSSFSVYVFRYAEVVIVRMRWKKLNWRVHILLRSLGICLNKLLGLSAKIPPRGFLMWNPWSTGFSFESSTFTSRFTGTKTCLHLKIRLFEYISKQQHCIRDRIYNSYMCTVYCPRLCSLSCTRYRCTCLFQLHMFPHSHK